MCECEHRGLAAALSRAVWATAKLWMKREEAGEPANECLPAGLLTFAWLRARSKVQSSSDVPLHPQWSRHDV